MEKLDKASKPYNNGTLSRMHYYSGLYTASLLRLWAVNNKCTAE